MKKSILFFLLLAFSLQNCTKGFEETNKNPFFPTTTDIGPLMNTVIESMRLGWNEQFYLHNERLYEVTQLAARTEVGFDNTTIGTEEVWENTYKALAHIREIERRLADIEIEEEAKNNVSAQVRILKAYKMFRLTDLFGDVPYSEAGRGFEDLEFARPKYDSQEAIYTTLLEDLAWAEQNMVPFADATTDAGTPYLSLGAFDNLFQGDLMRWRKFGNALRLRHALRMYEKKPNEAASIIKDIIENELPLIEEGEEVVMLPSTQQWRNEGVNWSFREHNRLRLGTNMWAQVSETNILDGSGIFDPRARIFFEPNNANEWAAFLQNPDAAVAPSGGIPYGQHRDGNFAIKGADNIYAPFNYYLIRDEQDVPEIILTAAEVHLAKAECYLRGIGVAQNTPQAESEYTIGMAASLGFWQNIVTNSAIWTNKPPTLSTGDIFATLNHPKLSIFTATDKLALIYTQRWVDSFRQPWEAFALWRRTKTTPREGADPNFYRFAYPPSEAVNNPTSWAEQVGKMGADESNVAVWWME